MSLRQTVKLELEDGREVTATYDGRDLRAWEAQHKKSALQEDLSIEMLTWLGHHAAIRTRVLNGELTTYEAFEAVCVSVQGLRTQAGGADSPPTKRPKASQKKAGADSSVP